MRHGSILKIGRSQAIRLPKAPAWPDDVKRVEVAAVGRSRLIAPTGELWDSWFEQDTVSSGYMSERDQPANQAR